MLRAGCVPRVGVLKCLTSDGACHSMRRGFRQLNVRLPSSSSEVSTPYWALKTDRLTHVQIWRLTHREIHAVRALLSRPGFGNATSSKFLLFNGSHGFHSSPTSLIRQKNNQKNSKKNKEKGDKEKSAKEKGDRKKHSKENGDKSKTEFDAMEQARILMMFAKVILFFALPVAVISSFSSASQVPSVHDDDEMDCYIWFPQKSRVSSKVTWNEFVHHMLAKGEVHHVRMRPGSGLVSIHLNDGAFFKDKPAPFSTFYMVVEDTDRFEKKLRDVEQQLGIRPEDSLPIKYEYLDDTKMGFFLLLLTFLLFRPLFTKNFWQMKKFQFPWTKAQFTLVDSATRGEGVKFSDIAGLKEAKQEVMEFVDYLKKPEQYSKLGAKVPKGTLLLGPPGCGKTLLAKAVATEANVPFLSMNGSEFSDMIGGVGASRVRDLFDQARKLAPCIIYIDEIDAIGRKRADMTTNDGDQTLNQLLVELDGMETKGKVIMLASTNRSDILDKALTRAGRFDRHILIDVPTAEERKEIFEQHLKSIKLEHPPTFYSKHFAQRTPGFTGADIANICNEAALHAARNQKQIAQQSDLEYAVDRVLYGAEKKTHSCSVQSRQQAAFYHAGRVLVGWFLEHTDGLLKVSILSRARHNLGTTQFNTSEKFLISNDELLDRMAMNLGGRAAEELIFRRTSSLSEEDLKKVTNIAYNMVETFGMNETVGMVSFKKEPYMKRFYSRKLHGMIDLEARKLIANSYDTARNILKEHEDKLKLIAEKLIEKETLSYDDICALIGPPPHGHKKLVSGIDFGVQPVEGEGTEPVEGEDNSDSPTDESSSKEGTEKMSIL